MTKKELQEKLAQVRKQREEKEAKARLESRRIQLENRAKARKQESRKTVIQEKAAKRQQQGPKSITEAVNQRIAKFPEAQKPIYKVLSENIANTVASMRAINEATQADSYVPGALGDAAGVNLVKTYFDIFFGYFPNLIATEIASTQPIKTQEAVVFYYHTVAGDTKGNVTKGDTLITPFEVNTDVNYSSQVIDMPAVSATGAYSQARALWGPVIARSVKIEGATLTWSTDTAFTGVLKDGGTDINITAGSVTVGTDDVTVAFTLDAEPSKAYKVTYDYENRYAPTQVPSLEAKVVPVSISAKARTIKTNMSFQAGYGFEQSFGKSLADQLAETAMFELKRETDLDFVFEVMNAAPVKIKWNRSAGLANGLYEIHKKSFRDAVVAASNYIYKKSKRVRGNILLVGINAQTIVETLDDYSGEEYGSDLKGAKVIGKLGKNIKVIAIPELGENDWAVIFKDSKDNLDAGIIFAPYIPVMATNPVMLEDFLVRRAYTCSYGKKVINANYFVRGEIIDSPVAQSVFLVSKDGTDTALGDLGVDANLPTIPVVA